MYRLYRVNNYINVSYQYYLCYYNYKWETVYRAFTAKRRDELTKFYMCSLETAARMESDIDYFLSPSTPPFSKIESLYENCFKGIKHRVHFIY